MILLIDNYDSFSYNLYQLIGSLDPDIKVVRNDMINVNEIRRLHPKRIILSPGPGRPENAGICEEVVRELSGEMPILGVCLGHQAIVDAFGGEVSNAARLMHGKKSVAKVENAVQIFRGLPTSVEVARYHSLSAVESSLPDCLDVIAVSLDDGEIMGVKHKSHSTYGLQFHPESILTPDGKWMMRNFITREA